MVACKTADANGLRAEAYYQLARAHHYQVDSVNGRMLQVV
jgi:hypothetical protein